MAAPAKLVLVVVMAFGALALSASGRTGPPPRTPRPTVEAVLKRAAEVAADIEEPQERARLLALIALGHHRAGNKAAADRLLKRALEVAETIDEDTPLYSALMQITSVEARRGNWPGVLKTCDKMENKSRRASLIAFGVRDLADAGHLETARKAARAMKGEARSNGLMAVGIAEAKAGKIEAALRTAADVTEGWHSWEVLLEVARAQARAKQPDKARKTLADVRALIDRTEAKRFFLWQAELALAQAECGDVKGALETIAEAERLEDKAYDAARRREKYMRLAIALAAAGDRKSVV